MPTENRRAYDVLGLMIEDVENDRWIRHRMADGHGNRCAVGMARYHSGRSAERSKQVIGALVAALPSGPYPNDINATARVMDYNDCHSKNVILAWFKRARELA